MAVRIQLHLTCHGNLCPTSIHLYQSRKGANGRTQWYQHFTPGPLSENGFVRRSSSLCVGGQIVEAENDFSLLLRELRWTKRKNPKEKAVASELNVCFVLFWGNSVEIMHMTTKNWTKIPLWNQNWSLWADFLEDAKCNFSRLISDVESLGHVRTWRSLSAVNGRSCPMSGTLVTDACVSQMEVWGQNLTTTCHHGSLESHLPCSTSGTKMSWIKEQSVLQSEINYQTEEWLYLVWGYKRQTNSWVALVFSVVLSSEFFSKVRATRQTDLQAYSEKINLEKLVEMVLLCSMHIRHHSFRVLDAEAEKPLRMIFMKGRSTNPLVFILLSKHALSTKM